MSAATRFFSLEFAALLATLRGAGAWFLVDSLQRVPSRSALTQLGGHLTQLATCAIAVRTCVVNAQTLNAKGVVPWCSIIVHTAKRC